jgi:hypothetical protein
MFPVGLGTVLLYNTVVLLQTLNLQVECLDSFILEPDELLQGQQLLFCVPSFLLQSWMALS